MTNKKIELETASSIIQKIDMPWFTPGHFDLYLKRDDLIHPFISGNKWRKLKYNLLEARKHGKTTLVTFGGAWSNHLLATACAGATFGFNTIGIVRGEKPASPSLVLSLCSCFGMKLEYVSREAYRNKKMLEERFADPLFYFIPEGGSNEFCVHGVSELFTELNTSYDFLYTAAGTGGTTAGLLVGASESKLDTRIKSVVVLKNGSYLEEEIRQLGAPLAALDLLTDSHHGGYADSSPELISFMKRFMADTGILLDPVYTGKMMYALWTDLNNRTVPEGSKILALHTGGLTGLLSDKYLKELS